MSLHVETPEGAGPWCLFVHGMLSSREQFRLNLESLRECVRPVVVELWGHGRSPQPENGSLCHPASYVEAFERIREDLAIDRWLLCGQSFGAALTLRYALDHPHRVTGHVMTNSASAFGDATWRERTREMTEGSVREILAGGNEAVRQIRIHPRFARRLPDDAREVLVSEADRVSAKTLACHLEGIADAPQTDRIHENVVPSLLICGDREKAFAAPCAFAEEHMPQLEVVHLDAGHAVNIQEAEAFNEAVARFVRGLSG